MKKNLGAPQKLVIVPSSAFVPVLGGHADECDVVVTQDLVLLPPVQLYPVLAAHLHQPVHQIQGDDPAQLPSEVSVEAGNRSGVQMIEMRVTYEDSVDPRQLLHCAGGSL